MEDKFREILNSIGVACDEHSEDSDIVVCFNHYSGNGGYHHIIYSNSEILLLKGIYKDFTREVSGENPFTERELTKISEGLSNIEKSCSVFFRCEIIKNQDFTVKDLKELKEVYKRDIFLKIKRPLSLVEYNIFKDGFADSENLYSSGILGISPKITNPVLFCSIVKKIPDVMSVIFAHSGLKVYSPSTKVIFNKIFSNYSTMHMAFSTFSDEKLLKFFFSQPRFLKDKRFNFKTPKIKFMNLSLAEAEELLDEFKQKTDAMDESFLFSEGFYETISIGFMIYQIALLLFVENFSKLNNILNDYNLTLKAVYKTRSSSPFYNNKKIKVARITEKRLFFVEIEQKLGETVLSLSEILKSVPAVTRFLNRAKIEKLAGVLHRILDFRDRFYFSVTDFLESLSKIFDGISGRLVKSCKFKYEEQLYYMEIDEIKKLLNDAHYGNLQFTYFFKKWQTERFDAQLLPDEIFEKDIDDVEYIVRNMVSSTLEKKTLPVLSFFHREDFSDMDKITCLKDGFPENFMSIKNGMKILSANVSPFSWVMEMAAISDTPLYCGVRFPEFVLHGKKIHLTKDKLDME